MLYIFHIVQCTDGKYMLLAATDRQTAYDNKANLRIKSPDAYKITIDKDLLHVQNTYIKSLQHSFIMSEEVQKKNVFFIKRPSVVVSVRPMTLEEISGIIDDNEMSYNAQEIYKAMLPQGFTYIAKKILSSFKK